MSSIIRADTIQDLSGNNIINESGNTITIGASGDTITIPSGATISNSGTATGFGETNLPFFSVQEASTTSFSDATKTQVQFDTENFDSGGCYNNTGSTVTLNGVSAPAYSFAPNVAGTYLFLVELQCYSSGGQLNNAIAYIGKNGTDFVKTSSNHSGSGPFVETITGFGFANLNGTSDYVTASVYMDVGTGTPSLLGGTGSNMFMGLRISAT
jgi:hypothetical protein